MTDPDTFRPRIRSWDWSSALDIVRMAPAVRRAKGWATTKLSMSKARSMTVKMMAEVKLGMVDEMCLGIRVFDGVT